MMPTDERQSGSSEDALAQWLERLRARARAGAELAGPAAPPTVNCPPQDFWPLFVQGIAPQEPAIADLAHAAGCDHCGPLLLAALAGRDMQAVLRALPSSRPRQQARLARALARHRGRPKPGNPVPPLWPPRWRSAAGALAIVLIAAAGLAWWQHARAQAPARLLAQAYSANRTLDFRIAGAAFAPLALRRGAASQPPAPLLQAEADIAAGLEKNPADPALLALRGRAELLELRYGAAIADLTASLQRSPGSPAALTDLGSAYFERARQTGHAADFQPALEYLGRALALAPADPLALYNRALVEEQFPMPAQAMQDWTAYLQADATGAWAAEARRHLDALKKK